MSQEVTTYAGCLVPVYDGEEKANVNIKGRAVNDTELAYAGEVERMRLMPRALGLLNNTCTNMQVGACAHLSFTGGGLVAVASGEQKTCVVTAWIDGQESQHTVEGAGAFMKCQELQAGEHNLTLRVEQGELKLDRIILTGRNANLYRIPAITDAYVRATPGFAAQDMALSCAIAGEELEIYCYGPWVELYFLPNQEGVAEILVNGQLYKNVPLRSRSAQVRSRVEGIAQERLSRVTIRVQAGTVALAALRLKNTTSVMAYMNLATDAELQAMVDDKRTASDPADWKPVCTPAKLPMQGVTLDGGWLRDCFERNITYLKDSLTKPRWVGAKDDDRIWVDMLVASNEGRMLAGMGNTLRYKEVPEFRTGIESILDEVERRQFTNANGYCLPYESELFALSKFSWPDIMRDEIKNYDRAMFTKGVLAAGNAGYTEAFDILRKFYDWFNGAKEYLPGMLKGSMGIQGSVGGPLVYHCPTGVPQDIITNMKYYDMDWWLEFLATDIPEAVWRFTLNRPHNYLLTSISVLFDMYTATGEEKYLNACKGGYRIYRDYFQLTGGFITICEHFACPPKTHFISNVPNSIFETCAAVFWVDLTSRLLSLDPDNDEYASQMEQSIFNLMCACQGEDGKIRYFNHLNGQKYSPMHYNTCCEIQGTGFIGQLPQYVYMLIENGVQVNLFAPSSIAFAAKGKTFTLKQETAFPAKGDVRLTVSGSGEFTLRLRIPAWSNTTQVKVNGEVVGQYAPGSYATITRTWQDGDTISYALQQSFTYEKYTGMHRIEGCERYGFMRGPVLYCVKGALTEDCRQTETEPVVRLHMTPSELLANLEEVDALSYKIKGTDYQFVPYASFMDGSTFSCFPAMDAEI